MKYWIVSSLLLVSLLSGCATIVGEPTQLLPIASSPDGATVVIIDERGAEVFKGVTPTTVTLAKSDGSYWGKKEYTAVISKDGFSRYELPIKSSANGWYIGGNLIFGGIIGYFIVDPLNGNMYTLSVKDINATLAPTEAINASGKEQVNIVLVDDIPEALKPKMVRIN